ncbi:MAG: adenylosuccinate synthase [Vampirovibrionales bacterium]|nr:adenylosuccinate synthase [Vampirovibrionales bacterium]
MPVIAVLGAQWGDEGKAKIIDALAEQAGAIIRSQGGCNAGHTVVHQGETYKFHHLPSGLLYPGKLCVMGPGTVIHPEVLQKELEAVAARGLDLSALKISERAHITMPYHLWQEERQEYALSAHKIGTTGKGIGPTYMDKVGRLGIRVSDLFEDDDTLRAQLERISTVKQAFYGSQVPELLKNVDDLLALCRQYQPLFAPYVADTSELLQALLEAKPDALVLFEGAQGAMLDVDYGTYPFVTSSNTTIGGVCVGSGLPPKMLTHTMGVMKAYLTRVGNGPFPTELFDEIGDFLADKGREFGTTTGRKRRCGWFDAVQARYSAQINGLDSIALNKLDVLTGLDEINICVGYRHRKTHAVIERFPTRLGLLADCEPVYQTLPGWDPSLDLTKVRRFEDLPQEAQQLLRAIEQSVGVPVSVISVGPDRAETILHEAPLPMAFA